MSDLILTNADLSDPSSKFSEDVETPNLWRVTAIVTGAKVEDKTTVRIWGKSGNGDYFPLLRGDDSWIKFIVYGNSTKSINPIIVNCEIGRVEVIPNKPEGKGLCSIDSSNK